MHSRRTIVLSAAAMAAAARLARADAPAPNDGLPHASAEPGPPPYLDFGDGLKVPLGKGIFLTLWEGKTFWITYGYGRASDSLRANGKAVRFAEGAMKLLLLTLAFSPERLDHVNGCGWRLKDQKKRNYVLGDVDLPGKPYRPVSDSRMGFGNADSSVLTGSANMGGETLANPGEGSSAVSGGYGVDITGSFTKVDAYTAYIVMKTDADLDYVRASAQLL